MSCVLSCPFNDEDVKEEVKKVNRMKRTTRKGVKMNAKAVFIYVLIS
jgi:hypothetical protein